MNMNLKGIMQTLGAKPGQVMSDPYARAWAPTPSPIKEAEGEDHEVSMAQNSLDTIIKMATELKAKMGENEKDIPAWIQDHITNSENFISQASSNYHEYSTNEAGINGAPRFPSLDGVANESITEGKNESINESKESDILAKIEKLRVDAEAGKIKTLDQFLDKFKPLQKQLKALGESVNEVSYNVKADNAYQFINGATAVLGMYLKDEKLESGVKNTLQRVVKDLEGLRKYFFNRKDESINKSLRLTKIK
jgi:viroplasmin and RNaseH domain-containing protein